MYVVVTAATGNLALVIAAAVMGALFSLFERLSTRGVLAPIVTHLTWSTLMVLALPRDKRTAAESDTFVWTR